MRIFPVHRKIIKPHDIQMDGTRSKHVDSIVSLIEQGIEVCPVVIDIEGCMISGYYIYHACKRHMCQYIPTCVAVHLTRPQINAFKLADINSKSYWDDEQIFNGIFDQYKSPEEKSVVGFEELEFLRKVINAQEKNINQWKK